MSRVLSIVADLDAVVMTETQAERYNVAPTQDVPIVVHRAEEDRRELHAARWGLVPSWAKDSKVGTKMANARAESVADKPSFRRPFASERALIPVSGFYEWKRDVTPKQPYCTHPGDDGLITFAGLYEWWRDPDQPGDSADRWLLTCAIITTAAAGPQAKIHTRMPAHRSTTPPGSTTRRRRWTCCRCSLRTHPRCRSIWTSTRFPPRSTTPATKASS